MNIRLQKFMAECGVASRRRAEEMIAAGKVKVNGRLVTEPGTKVDPRHDRVMVEGRLLKQKERKLYIKLFKPIGYISSCRSERGERTVIDLVKNVPYRLYPVGRLDKDSEGLIILTNDGELADRLMHPRYEHEKEYEVDVKSPLTGAMLEALAQGIELEGVRTLPVKILLDSTRRFRIILKEGRNRQIRRMVAAVGNEVQHLKRIRIRSIRLGPLRPGQFCQLSDSEVKSLLA